MLTDAFRKIPLLNAKAVAVPLSIADHIGKSNKLLVKH